MLKEKLFWGSIVGFFFVCIAGTVNHFLYELSGNNVFIGVLTPVNESVWEHLKLLFFPFLIFCIGEFAVYGKHICGFWFLRFVGVLSGMVLIPLVFYIYSGIIGRSIVVVDILIFFVSVFVSYFISYLLVCRGHECKRYENIIGILLFLIFVILFTILTLI